MTELYGYKRLNAWQKADELAHKVYDVTPKFTKQEIYSLTSQLRRAALSVAANIIEGHGRYSKNEFRHFLSLALGSLAEAGYYLEFALKRKYLNDREFQEVDSLRQECGKLLWKLHQSQK